MRSRKIESVVSQSSGFVNRKEADVVLFVYFQLTTMATRSLRPAISLARRQLSSSDPSIASRVGVIKRRSKPGRKLSPATEPKQQPSEFIDPDSPFVSTSTHAKNGVMAISLIGFCFGVAWYSMNAVGQAGSSDDDPLSALKIEAEAARERKEKEGRDLEEATAMLKQLDAGQVDPDTYEDEEEAKISEGNGKQKKRSWWKFLFFKKE